MIRAALLSFVVLAVGASEARSQLNNLPTGFIQPRPPFGTGMQSNGLLRNAALGIDSQALLTAPSGALESPASTTPKAVVPATIDLSGIGISPQQLTDSRPLAVSAMPNATSLLWPTASPPPGGISSTPRMAGELAARLWHPARKIVAASALCEDGLPDLAKTYLRQAELELAQEPDSPQIVPLLSAIVTLQTLLAERSMAEETVGRLWRLAVKHAQPNSNLRGFVQHLLALREYRAGRLEDALRHAENSVGECLSHGDPTNDVHISRSLRYEILQRLGRSDEAAACAQLNREECERTFGKYSPEAVKCAIEESEAVRSLEGGARGTAILDDYAETRVIAVPVDLLTIALEVHRARARLREGNPSKSAQFLRNATVMAEAVLPHRVPHLHLCRAYVEDFRRDPIAARSAFDDAVSLAVRLQGSENDAVKALKKRAAHFTEKKDRRTKGPHFDDAGLDRLLNEFAAMMVWENRSIATMPPGISSLELDPFFCRGSWVVLQRTDEVHRRLGIVFEHVDPALVPSYAGALRVKGVRSQTPAAKQGVRDGDLLVEIDGKQIVSVSSIPMVVHDWKKHPSLKLTLLRGSDKIELYVGVVEPN